MSKSLEKSSVSPPSIPPPEFCSASASKQTTELCSAYKTSEQKAEAGRGDGSLREGETSDWIDRFVERLVEKFGCPDERSSYLGFCRRYPENVLEDAYARVCDIPRERIRKSPGALFIYLVKKLNQER